MSQQARESLQSDGERSALLVGRCEACGQYTFPVREGCPSCLSEAMAETTVTDGRLETFASIHTPKEGFPSPYTIGFVRITDDGLRVFSYLTDPVEDLAVGDTVHVQSTSVGEFDETWAFGLEVSNV